LLLRILAPGRSCAPVTSGNPLWTPAALGLLPIAAFGLPAQQLALREDRSELGKRARTLSAQRERRAPYDALACVLSIGIRPITSHLRFTLGHAARWIEVARYEPGVDFRRSRCHGAPRVQAAL
jgi:hypothetical protein